jgi:hypothetical protein
MKRTSPVPNLDKEVILEAKNLTNPEARFLSANYYASQKMRMRVDMQLRHMSKDLTEEDGGKFKLLNYTTLGFGSMEEQVAKALAKYAESTQVGRWALAQMGVGPVIVAGLLAHLDITEADTVGHFWRFAGRDPTCVWEEGEKRPYCARLKLLTFHLGQSFKRNHNRADCFYGKLYEIKKAKLIARNEAGGFKEKAAVFHLKDGTKENKALLKNGMVPPFYIDTIACTYAVKIFLSHLHAVMFWDHYHRAPPRPFAIAHLNHGHEIKIPDLHMFPGLEKVYYGGLIKSPKSKALSPKLKKLKSRGQMASASVE